MRFILVDKILEMIPGQSIKALKHITEDEPYFQDHFPGFPVVPGVLLTEMMAQATGKCLDAEGLPRGKAMLAKITSAGFRDWVRPGQDCLLFAAVRKNRPQFAIADTYITVDDRKVCSAELMFFVPAHRSVRTGSTRPGPGSLSGKRGNDPWLICSRSRANVRSLPGAHGGSAGPSPCNSRGPALR